MLTLRKKAKKKRHEHETTLLGDKGCRGVSDSANRQSEYCFVKTWMVNGNGTTF